ncbi:ABC transporter substrate-binding protein [Bacteroidia bacterium]|nr:ABC transporter substrate-binding protein [Bacteroidia bacterium]
MPQSAEPGHWSDHYSYHKIFGIASGDDKIFALTENGLLIYNKKENSHLKYSTVQGLSAVGLSAIEFEPTTHTLLIGYEDGNLDFWHNNSVFNLSDIKRAEISGSKRINKMTVADNGLVYLSCDFGIVLVNVLKQEIAATYFIGKNYAPLKVNDVAVCNSKIYAATHKGLMQSDISNVLSDFSQWSQVNDISDTTKKFKFVASFENNVFACLNNETDSKDSIWQFKDNNWTVFDTSKTEYLRVCGKKMLQIVSDTNSDNTIRIFDKNMNERKLESHEHLSGYKNFFTAIVDEDDNVWISSYKKGDAMICFYAATGNIRYFDYDGPGSNDLYSLSCSRNRLYVAGGALSQYYEPGGMSFYVGEYNGKSWRNHHEYYGDVIQVLENPLNPDEFYAACWGQGIVVINSKTNEHIHYTEENSTLQPAFWGAYQCGGIYFDRFNNLWATMSLSPYRINKKDANGNWKSYSLETFLSWVQIRDICVDYYQQVWFKKWDNELVIMREANNSNGYECLNVDLNRGNNYSTSKINCILEDQKGYIWVGTDKGVKVNYTSASIFNNPVGSTSSTEFHTVIHEGRPLLENDNVTCITIDGNDRKWIGTSSSGVFLMSADGKEKLLQFNMTNSPLNSNIIKSIAVHPITGEVFILTYKGLMSYQGDASEPEQEMDNVVIFPNPVKSSYEGQITIRGLAADCDVKIVDASGRLVNETTSNGGIAVWDGKNMQNKRVAYGVYFVFLVEKSGKQKAVKKIVFRE